MKTVRVGDVAEQVRGVTFAKSDAVSTPRDGYLPVLTAGNIQEGRLVTDELTYVPQDKVRDKQRVRTNDIVVCSSSGSLRVVGKAARSRGEFTGGFGAFLKVLRPGPEVDPAYFAHFFQTTGYRRKVSHLAAGANINNLKNEHLDNLALPLPPLEEQRRIAAILDEADALRAKRREGLAQLDRLVEAVYESGIAAQASTYPVAVFAELISDAQLGLVRSAALQGPDREYEYLRMDSITRTGGLDLSSVTRVDASAIEAAKYEVRDGDLLFNTRNTRELVGKTVVYRGVPRLYNNNLMRIRFNERVVPEYVHRYLRSSPGRKQLEARKSGTTSVFAIYAKSLADLEVPVPPLAMQRDFASQLASIEAQRAAMRSALEAEDELAASLQFEAFRGRL